jgi:hypothetical protein
MSQEPKNIAGYKKPKDYTTVLDSTTANFAPNFGSNFSFLCQLHGVAPKTSFINSSLVIETDESKQLESGETEDKLFKTIVLAQRQKP